MPQPGEIRRGATESVQWNGERWSPIVHGEESVDKPISFGVLDMVPGLRDVLNLPTNIVKGAKALPDVARGIVNEPGATMKGFVKGSSEAATPERIGMLALLTGGATLPAALGAAGGEALAEGARVATDAPNAARSFPEAAGNVLGAASVPALAGALNAAPTAIARMGGARKVAGGVLGAGLGGYEGYRYGGIPGGIAGAIGGGALGGGSGGSRSMRALRAILGPEAEASPKVPQTVAQTIDEAVGAGKLRRSEGYVPEVAPRLIGASVPSESAPSMRGLEAAVTEKPRLSLEEFKAAQELVKQGHAPEDVMMAIQQNRRPASWQGLPNDEEVAATIADRNASGRWPR